MYIENYDSSFVPVKKRSGKIWLIASTAALIIIIVVVIIAGNSSGTIATSDYKLIKTDFTGQNFTYLSGSEIYAYNGLAFYKTDINTKSVTVLNSGLRLPTPSSITWAGSQGALLSFKDSFSLTAVEKALATSNTPLNELSESYVWYLDFKSGSLSVMSASPIAKKTVLFSDSANGFYYIPDLSRNRVPSAATQLIFYDVSTKAKRIVSSNLGLVSVSSVSNCSASELACVIDSDPTSQKLYSIDKSGQKALVYDSKGTLYNTNSSTLFISIPRVTDAKKANSAGTYYGPEDAYIFNSATNRTTSLKSKLQGPEINAAFDNEGNFFIADSAPIEDVEADSVPANSAEPSNYYIAGHIKDDKLKTVAKPLHLTDGTVLTDNISSLLGQGNNGTALVETLGGKQLLFGNNQSITAPVSDSQDTVSRIIKQCNSTNVQPSQYFNDTRTFRVYINDDDNFARSVNAFGSCMAKSPTSLVGYNYQLSGISPENGRITTD